MHIERLKMLSNMLRTVNPNHFDLGDWVDSPWSTREALAIPSSGLPQRIVECGTTACAVGWACTTPEFQAQGLSYKWDEVCYSSALSPTFDGKESWEAVCAFFEIDRPTADYLFSHHEYEVGRATPPSDVVERIEAVIRGEGTHG
ncbi:hypothetical protein [Burkholderia sp. Bp8998]|uniref:hypothetical protein n=1 Tax=Burkholderia sp. Bp8998 TaxID=2184557 RepID=UPI000F56574A|nr:hypothetical protein [Burkholderia sp. Bp8998]RQR63872.1 hypothetical protein DIE18_06995 [Burkholderia sp. Bp9125]RQS17114.1 hypothetical protein DIE06_18205 [Burkholderia sp. Bp8998]